MSIAPPHVPPLSEFLGRPCALRVVPASSGASTSNTRARQGEIQEAWHFMTTAQGQGRQGS